MWLERMPGIERFHDECDDKARRLKSFAAKGDAKRYVLCSTTFADSVANYIEDLQVNGRLVFTTDDAVRALVKASAPCALSSGGSKIKVASQFLTVAFTWSCRRSIGAWDACPPDHFILQLMEHLEEPYYVASLSAAVYLVALRIPR